MSKRAPRPASLTNSGNAFDKPPAPTSWMAKIGLSLPWTQHWLSSKGLQVAPQETEVESYVIGGIKQDVSKDTFAGFKL